MKSPAKTRPSAASIAAGERGGGLGRLDTRPAEPRVAVDEHAQRPRGAGRGGRKPRQEHGVVGADREVDAVEQRAQPRELRLAEDVERDEDVGAPAVGHHLGLAELLARDPARAELELAPRDLDAPVRLDVRAVREPDPVAVVLPAGEVALEPVEVDDRGRRLDLLAKAV